MKKIAKILMLIVTMVLVVFDIMAGYAYTTGGISVTAHMEKYVAGYQIAIYWHTNIEGADHYECTVRNQSTGDCPRERSTAGGGSCYVSGSRVKAGSYRVWVGAVDASGTVIADGYTYFTVKEKAECDHKWDDDEGSCIYCGVSCSHDNGVIEVKQRNSTFTSISNTHHKVVWKIVEECKICRYPVRQKEKKEEQRHSFESNGDCSLCDFRTGCKHTERKLEKYAPAYKSIDENRHSVKVVGDYVCANSNCGKVIEVAGYIDEYKENHSISNGQCKQCGYTEQRKALKVSISRGQSSATVGETISASCSISGGSGSYQYIWSVMRDGSSLYRTAEWVTRGSYVPSQSGKYSFSVQVKDLRTGETVTATTSAITVTKTSCSHSSTKTVQEGDPKYSKLSDTHHTKQINVADICTACNAKINGYLKNEQEKHSYVNGNCKYCGSSETNSRCKHQNVTSEEITRTWRKTASDSQHLVDIVWRDSCSDCRTLLNTTRTTTEYEKHEYSGNVCSKCKYAKVSNGCDHADRSKTKLSSSVEKKDATFHVIKTVYRVTCARCGIELDASYVDEKYENHTINNNACTRCGYNGNCSHSNQTKKFQGNSFVPMDGQKHNVLTYYKVSCEDCDKVIDSKYTTEAQFAHTIENGKCKHCGYVVNSELPQTESAVCPVYGDKHVFNYTGYEAKHESEFSGAHNEFVRCKCGHAKYTGKTMTNLPQSECCLCGNHVFGQAHQSGDVLEEKCVNCKYKREVGRVTDNEKKQEDQSILLKQILSSLDADEVRENTLQTFGEEAANSNSNISKIITQTMHSENRQVFDWGIAAVQKAENSFSHEFAEAVYKVSTDPVDALLSLGDDYTAELKETLIDVLSSMLLEREDSITQADVMEFFGNIDSTMGIFDDSVEYTVFSEEVQTWLHELTDTSNPMQKTIAEKWLGAVVDYDTYSVPESMDDVMDSMGILIDGLSLYGDYQEEYAQLVQLSLNYDQNMQYLQQIINNCGSYSLIGEACEELQQKMTDNMKEVFNYDFSDALKQQGAKGIEMALKFAAEKFMGRANPVGAFLIAGDIGSVLTSNSGKTIKAEEELLKLMHIDKLVTQETKDSFGEEECYAMLDLYMEVVRRGTKTTEEFYDAHFHTLGGAWQSWTSGVKLEYILDFAAQDMRDINNLENRLSAELFNVMTKEREKMASEIFADTLSNATPEPAPSPTPDPAGGRYGTVIATSGAKVREGAGTGFGKIDTVAYGARFKVMSSKVGTDGKVWYCINVNGKSGWISSGLFRLD